MFGERKKSHRCRSALITETGSRHSYRRWNVNSRYWWCLTLKLDISYFSSQAARSAGFGSSPITDSGAWFKTKTPQVLSQEGRQTHRTEHPGFSADFEVRRVALCLADLLVCFVWSRLKKAHMLEKSPKPEKSEMIQQWLNEQRTSGFLFLFKPEEHDAPTLCLWSKHNRLVYEWNRTHTRLKGQQVQLWSKIILLATHQYNLCLIHMVNCWLSKHIFQLVLCFGRNKLDLALLLVAR